MVNSYASRGWVHLVITISSPEYDCYGVENSHFEIGGMYYNGLSPSYADSYLLNCCHFEMIQY